MVKVNLQKYLTLPTRKRKTQISYLKKKKKNFSEAFQLSLVIWLAERTYTIEICLTFHVNLQLSINIKKKTPLNLYSKYQGITETPNLLLKSVASFYTLSEMQSNSYVVIFKRGVRGRSNFIKANAPGSPGADWIQFEKNWQP